MSRLVFRPLSAGFLRDLFGADYPAWVRKLKGKSGVYLIRNAGSSKVLYVGESHTGNLYETLTRHFQAWSGRTAGATFARGSVRVAVKVTPAGRAVAEQNRLICKFQPSENTLSPACELNKNPF